MIFSLHRINPMILPVLWDVVSDFKSDTIYNGSVENS